jgi:hypothetical protein
MDAERSPVFRKEHAVNYRRLKAKSSGKEADLKRVRLGEKFRILDNHKLSDLYSSPSIC